MQRLAIVIVMWTKPKPLLKFGYPNDLPKLDDCVGTVYAITDYAKGKTIYFRLSVYGPYGMHEEHTFPSFEQMMTYVDLNNIIVDTFGWDTYGITRCYDNHNIGDIMPFSDGHKEVLVGLDD